MNGDKSSARCILLVRFVLDYINTYWHCCPNRCITWQGWNMIRPRAFIIVALFDFMQIPFYFLLPIKQSRFWKQFKKTPLRYSFTVLDNAILKVFHGRLAIWYIGSKIKFKNPKPFSFSWSAICYTVYVHVYNSWGNFNEPQCGFQFLIAATIQIKWFS